MTNPAEPFSADPLRDDEGRRLTRSRAMRWLQIGLGVGATLGGAILLVLPEMGLAGPELGHGPDLAWRAGSGQGLGPATPIAGSLLSVLGIIFVLGGLRSTRAAHADPLGARALSFLGVAALVAGASFALLPPLGFEVALPVSALGLCGVGLGAALLLLGLRRSETRRRPPVEAPPSPQPHWFIRWRKRLSSLLPQRFFLATWRTLDREAEEARHRAGDRYDVAPLVTFALGAVFLAMMEYFGHGGTLRRLTDHFAPASVDDGLWAMMRDTRFARLLDFVWWSGWRVLGFFLLPCIVIRVVLGERIRDYGLSTADFWEHAWIYALFFGVVLVLVFGVSFGREFQSYYPFYRQASRSWYDFWLWEALYAAQFFSLEFFFRGFWLMAAKRAMGSHAIFAMTVPYCMIHFGKPYVETLAAVVAGIVLGTLALRTRSIWAGFLIHVSVAISMDALALIQTGGLPDAWFPAQ